MSDERNLMDRRNIEDDIDSVSADYQGEADSVDMQVEDDQIDDLQEETEGLINDDTDVESVEEGKGEEEEVDTDELDDERFLEAKSGEEHFELTLQGICDIVGADLKFPLDRFRSDTVKTINFDTVKLGYEEPCIVFDILSNDESAKRMRSYIEKGFFVVSSSDLYDENKIVMPSIKVDNVLEACHKLGGYFRNNVDMPLVAITGSVGKTTAARLLKNCVRQDDCI